MKHLYLISFCCALFLAGCGGDELEKAVVSGSVSYAGQPIENGNIFFYPREGTAGPVAGASINKGQYVAAGKKGVPVGEHEVQVRAFKVRQTGPLPDGVAPEDVPGQRYQYLPAKYNKACVLTASIPAGSRSLTLDFSLPE